MLIDDFYRPIFDFAQRVLSTDFVHRQIMLQVRTGIMNYSGYLRISWNNQKKRQRMQTMKQTHVLRPFIYQSPNCIIYFYAIVVLFLISQWFNNCLCLASSWGIGGGILGIETPGISSSSSNSLEFLWLWSMLAIPCSLKSTHDVNSCTGPVSLSAQL